MSQKDVIYFTSYSSCTFKVWWDWWWWGHYEFTTRVLWWNDLEISSTFEDVTGDNAVANSPAFWCHPEHACAKQMFPVSLVCGNTMVLKPSERDPGAVLLLMELMNEAGFLPGTINIVHGQHEGTGCSTGYWVPASYNSPPDESARGQIVTWDKMSLDYHTVFLHLNMFVLSLQTIAVLHMGEFFTFGAHNAFAGWLLRAGFSTAN